MARASAAQQRREYNASVREHNAMLRQVERQSKQDERDRIVQEKEEAIQYAIEKTNEAEAFRIEIQSILSKALLAPITMDWDKCKRNESFTTAEPIKMELKSLPEEIKKTSYIPKKDFLDFVSKKRYERKVLDSEKKYKEACQERDNQVRQINSINIEIVEQYQMSMKQWKNDKELFEKEKKEHNTRIDELRKQYIESSREAVEYYFENMICNIDLPDYYDITWDLQYNCDSKTLIVDMNLPTKEDIPSLKQMKYIQTRKEFSETELKEKDIDQIYDTVIYQLALRVSHDLYTCDIDNKLISIVFNGIFTGINKSTGNEETKCILSLQTKKDEFMEVNIRNVDAKACFIKFKGIASSKLSELVPIAPIISMDREDKRFVEGKDVAYKVEGQNLASMDWEEFEHLIRELFEKEFAINGAEIRITQASRDGGVDAVMFDPDPIRGGKYIIQAKRYTNVVGVSAVRDLYGTIMNEGAVKGILVTTANYGSDSYEFAKDKPITLISGNNLLHMLKKHGYNAKIDLEEAKKKLNNYQ